MAQSPQRQLKIELPANLSAVYSNAVMVSQTNTEIVLDFIQILPNDPRARVQSRVIMTPTGAKAFLNALRQNLERFEEKHGEIDVPTPPASLADQLFGSVKSEDEGNDD
ncbi:MAG: DUF3467 domain-containing protein [Anaerolineae bacterium]|nr:DUF3467 domain-containing protein [Anaerolineae bacterium]